MGNDERVLDVIEENEEALFNNGFSKIIGLRDMHSKAYRKKSKNVIDDEVTQQFIEAVTTVIASMNNPDKINFHFAIMELEAWWLSMYTRHGDKFNFFNQAGGHFYFPTYNQFSPTPIGVEFE